MLPSSVGCECGISVAQSGVLRPSISLLYHWSPFYQQFGHLQHDQYYPQQYPYQLQYAQFEARIIEEKEESPKQHSLDYVVNTEAPERERSRRNSAEMIEKDRPRGRRKYHSKYSFKHLSGRKPGSRQSEEIAQEFKRLGIGVCFQGIGVCWYKLCKELYGEGDLTLHQFSSNLMFSHTIYNSFLTLTGQASCYIVKTRNLDIL